MDPESLPTPRPSPDDLVYLEIRDPMVAFRPPLIGLMSSIVLEVVTFETLVPSR